MVRPAHQCAPVDLPYRLGAAAPGLLCVGHALPVAIGFLLRPVDAHTLPLFTVF